MEVSQENSSVVTFLVQLKQLKSFGSGFGFAF